MKGLLLFLFSGAMSAWLYAAAPSPGSSPSSRPLFKPLAAQSLSENFTITADSCGSLKLVTSTGAFTSNTTNTFTAPSASLAGCTMELVNVGDFNILLDSNALFFSSSPVSYVLGASDTIRVVTDGNFWFQSAAANN